MAHQPDTTDALAAELKAATDAVVSSASQRRLVVAGPGTGKTFLFQELVKAACCDPQQVLVLTFINNLKADLEKALTTTANVRTLHGYCHSLLRINGDLRDGLSREFFYFPNVPSLIKRDWELMYGDEAPQFIGLCRRLERGDETDFYIRRSSYCTAPGSLDTHLCYAAWRSSYSSRASIGV